MINFPVSISSISTYTQHPILQICRGAGALGSRLVGAGFGGCTISMVPKNVVSNRVLPIKSL